QEIARKQWEALLRLCEIIGLPVHDLVPPTLFTENFLGWGIDTAEMIVFIRKERQQRLIMELEKYTSPWTYGQIGISKGGLDSLIGVISFCAQVLHCLKAPLRHFIDLQTRHRHKEEFMIILLVNGKFLYANGSFII